MHLQLTGSTFVAFFGGFLHVLYKKFMPYASCMFLFSSVKNVTKLQVENSISLLFSVALHGCLTVGFDAMCCSFAACFVFFHYRSMSRPISQSCVGER